MQVAGALAQCVLQLIVLEIEHVLGLCDAAGGRQPTPRFQRWYPLYAQALLIDPEIVILLNREVLLRQRQGLPEEIHRPSRDPPQKRRLAGPAGRHQRSEFLFRIVVFARRVLTYQCVERRRVLLPGLFRHVQFVRPPAVQPVVFLDQVAERRPALHLGQRVVDIGRRCLAQDAHYARPFAGLLGEAPDGVACLHALVRKALQQLEVLAALRRAEQVRVHLLEEHDRRHGREHCQKMQVALALPLSHKHLQQRREVAVTQLPVVAVERLVVDVADLRLVLRVPPVEETRHVAAHAHPHLLHAFVHGCRVARPRLLAHVHVAVEDLEANLLERHRKVLQSLVEAAQECWQIHRTLQGRDAVGPVHEVDAPARFGVGRTRPIDRKAVPGGVFVHRELLAWANGRLLYCKRCRVRRRR